MPSILAGCVSIFIFYKLVHRCLESKIAHLLAISLYVTNSHILVYDQMARVYSIVMMLALGLFYCLIDIV